MRKFRKAKVRRMIAYDLETTLIKKGTPEVLYLTAFGADFKVSQPLKGTLHLGEIIISRFLTPEHNNARFIAWNGNNFDCFFIAAALLASRDYIIRPYLTRSKSLRGVRVTLKTKEGEPKQSWEFLDGISMISGGSPMTLKKFLKTFAPEYEKLSSPDWDAGETFDPSNTQHVAYAERDSEGLYHGLLKAESIVQEHFNQGLQPTIGNLGIRIFQAHMPEGKACWAPGYDLNRVIRKSIMRGGFCFAARKYAGPVWKYDLNQAYAAAMRDADLPAGRVTASRAVNPYAKCAVYRISAGSKTNRVPFYVRTASGESLFALREMNDVWVTSSELDQLKAERWSVTLHGGYFWEDGFRMRELVDKLESLRMADVDGPSGAQGSMMKAIGNNAYGKTCEELDGLELVMAFQKPEGFFEYQNAEDTIQNLWAKLGTPHFREYHQPQLGAFITAHVRMLVRRAILQAPDAWLYSDTDCCFFDRPVASLKCDAKKYGWWKIETAGEDYRIITKKVYAKFAFKADDKEGRRAKGMNIKRLNSGDFERWYNGTPPEQKQTHRQNFIAVMTGGEMFVDRVKFGASYRKQQERARVRV